jgi:hypothetical protein
MIVQTAHFANLNNIAFWQRGFVKLTQFVLSKARHTERFPRMEARLAGTLDLSCVCYENARTASGRYQGLSAEPWFLAHLPHGSPTILTRQAGVQSQRSWLPER